MPVKCKRKDCKNQLPPDAVVQKKYCGQACQKMDWRNKKKEQDKPK